MRRRKWFLATGVLLSALLPGCPAIVGPGQVLVTNRARECEYGFPVPGQTAGRHGCRGVENVVGNCGTEAWGILRLRGGGFWIWGNNKDESNSTTMGLETLSRNGSRVSGINISASEESRLSQMLADAIVMGKENLPGKDSVESRGGSVPEDGLAPSTRVKTRTATTEVMSGSPARQRLVSALVGEDSEVGADEDKEAQEDERGEDEEDVLPIDCLVVEPDEQHTATIIWLHGYGDEADDFRALPEALAVPWCKFVFPKAPLTAVESPRGDGAVLQLRSWFEHSPEDLRAADGPSPLGATGRRGLEASARAIVRLAEAEMCNGVPSKRILLAGFAQGGVVAMHAALAARERLGGLVVLSSWLPRGLRVSPSKAAYRLRALVCHGRGDPLVPVRLARAAFQSLLSLGVQAEFREYTLMAHDFCSPELTDVKHFVLSQAPRVQRLLTTKANPAAREGWCRRRVDGGIPKMRSWLARYLVLRDNVLLLYGADPSQAGESRALEDKDLDWTEAVASDKKTAGCSIELRDSNDQTSSFYHFPSRSERDQWLDAIALSKKWQKEESERHQRVTLANAGAGGPHTRGLSGNRRVSGDRGLLRQEKPTWLGALRGPAPPPPAAYGGSRPDPRPLPPPRKAIWENLVFSGGGIKVPRFHTPHARPPRGAPPWLLPWPLCACTDGKAHGQVLAFPAALAAIADYYGEQGRNLRWVKRVAGVSGGTIIATAIACGCSVDDIMDTAKVFDLTEIQDTIQNAGTLQTMRRLLSTYGVMDGNVLAQKVEQMIYTHTGLKGATFQQLYDHTGILLKIFATSLRNGQLFEFSALRTPNDQVAMAARCSMAVPFLFDAVPTAEGDLLVDGAMIDNCPVACFDGLDDPPLPFRAHCRARPTRPNPRTLAFWIAARSSPQQAAPRSVRAFCLRLVDLVLFMQQKQQKSFFHGDERVVWVQSPDISISTFKIDAAEEQLLLRCGRNSARHFMHHPGEVTPYHDDPPSEIPPPRGLLHLLTRAVSSAEHSIFDKWRSQQHQESAIDRFIRYWLSVRQRSQALLPPLESPEAGPDTSRAHRLSQR
jgi:phospholipase/carboxylesterase